MSIRVTDPAKCSDKYGQVFISYRVTSVNSRSVSVGTVTVVRRYNDFTWFHSVLSAQYPGVIMPPLPEKQAVGRFSNEFVESRRRGLEKYLKRISDHPELSTSEHFVTFLQTDDSNLLKLKEDFKAAKPALSASAAKWIENKVHTISSGGKDLEKSAADMKIVEILQYVNSLEKQMANVTKYSENLIKRNRDISQAMFEFGQSFTSLGQSEGDVIGEGLTHLGSAAESLSVITSAHAEDQVVKLLEPFEEYSRMLSSIKTAIQQRQDIKSAYMHSISDLESKQNALKKVANVPGKETLALSKEQAVSTAKEAMDTAKYEYERVSERLLIEYETFKCRKVADIKEIILNFVTLQIEFHKKSEEAWTELLPKIESISVPEISANAGRPAMYTSFTNPVANLNSATNGGHSVSDDASTDYGWQRQSDNGSGNPFGDDELPFTNEPSPTPHHAVDRRDIFSYRVDSGRVAVGSQAEDEDEEEDITGV